MERVVGQERAIGAVSNAVRCTGRTQDENRPIGSFMFLGPTGVGKTELSKALAEFFDDERAMIRIDMSESMEKHTVARLIGAPPGYVGYEEGGQLSEAVRRRPYSVVLFDEIEKPITTSSTFCSRCSMMGESPTAKANRRFQEYGDHHDLKHRQPIHHGRSQGGAGPSSPMMCAHFRPEFLNRIDEIIIFDRLDDRQITKIVDFQSSGSSSGSATERSAWNSPMTPTIPGQGGL